MIESIIISKFTEDVHYVASRLQSRNIGFGSGDLGFLGVGFYMNAGRKYGDTCGGALVAQDVSSAFGRNSPIVYTRLKFLRNAFTGILFI